MSVAISIPLYQRFIWLMYHRLISDPWAESCSLVSDISGFITVLNPEGPRFTFSRQGDFEEIYDV
jgi:hypothetical protein